MNTESVKSFIAQAIEQHKQFLSPRDLAAAMGVSESSFKRWVDKGEIRAIRTRGGHRRIAVSEAVRFVRQTRRTLVQPRVLGLLGQSADSVVRTMASSDVTEALFTALRKDDPAGASAVLLGRYLAGDSIAAIGDGPLRAAMERVGELWHGGVEGILAEHRAVDTCVHVLASLRALIPEPDPRAPVALVASGPKDPYVLAPLLTSLVLADSGCRTVNLGPQTPLEVLLLAIKRYRPRVCALSVSVADTEFANVGVLRVSSEMRELDGSLLVGGRCRGSLSTKTRALIVDVDTLVQLAAFGHGVLSGYGD